MLKGLFHVDHLATRIRRHAENLAVLGGAVSRRQWSNPVSMTEVLRSAIAEVEQYSRVKLVPPIDGTLRGHAVADVIHLLAELVENATVFSAPHTQVLLRANLVTSGLAVEVEDRGLGMPVGEQQRMNALLADPDQVNVASLLADGRIGLFVVSQLAKRHGIHVRLQTNIYGGVQAVLVVPQALLGSAPGVEPSPGGVVGAVGAGGTAGAGGGAGGVGGPGAGAPEQGAGSRRGGHEPRHRAVPSPSGDPQHRGRSGGRQEASVGRSGDAGRYTEPGVNGNAAPTVNGSGALGHAEGGVAGAVVGDGGRVPGPGSVASAGDGTVRGGGAGAGGGTSAGGGFGANGVGSSPEGRRSAPGDGLGASGSVPFSDGSGSASGSGRGSSGGARAESGSGAVSGGAGHLPGATGSGPGSPAVGSNGVGSGLNGDSGVGHAGVGHAGVGPNGSGVDAGRDAPPLPVRGPREERPNPAEAVPGIRAGDRRLVADHAVGPPLPRTGVVRGTMGKPQLPRRRAQEHIAPQLRGGPAPRQDAETPAAHDPGLMAAFQRGISLAEAQQHLESEDIDPVTPMATTPMESAHTTSRYADGAHMGSTHMGPPQADAPYMGSAHTDVAHTETAYTGPATTGIAHTYSAPPAPASFDPSFTRDTSRPEASRPDAHHPDTAPTTHTGSMGLTHMDRTHVDSTHISEPRGARDGATAPRHDLDLDRTTRPDGSAPAG
ncbi:ATP-binding protein [Streptomyces sp. NPDC047072]|uniref:sensor histidine kinase n=1 Tax=Streptomyces sp. NPDC047072 TaxID=3154809 RepID=UPI00340FE081